VTIINKSSQMSNKTIKTLTSTWQPFLFKGNFIFLFGFTWSMNIYFIIQILRSRSGVFFIKPNAKDVKVELLFLSFHTYQPRPWWLSFERDDCVTIECSFTPISRSLHVICCLIADIFCSNERCVRFVVMFVAIFDSLVKSHENKKSNSCCTTGYFPCEGCLKSC